MGDADSGLSQKPKKVSVIGGYFDEITGYRYHSFKKPYANGNIPLRCSRYKHKNPCRGSATLQTDGIYKINTPHTHEGDIHELKILQLKKEVFEMYKLDPVAKNPKEMFNKKVSEDPDIGKRLSYNSMDSHIHKLRSDHKKNEENRDRRESKFQETEV
ncbi:hypothetical protein QAD02_006440 [Eretmocerus hayati]|uniref:Uncharacterized protein n=1 Tax=Eretmocerus hayati TaxID=131215 RepID=A0ACC2N0Z9_9HYME|nr:hypothetical protein QAD02_006440 [Eretmocerus hayati]